MSTGIKSKDFRAQRDFEIEVFLEFAQELYGRYGATNPEIPCLFDFYKRRLAGDNPKDISARKWVTESCRRFPFQTNNSLSQCHQRFRCRYSANCQFMDRVHIYNLCRRFLCSAIRRTRVPWSNSSLKDAIFGSVRVDFCFRVSSSSIVSLPCHWGRAIGDLLVTEHDRFFLVCFSEQSLITLLHYDLYGLSWEESSALARSESIVDNRLDRPLVRLCWGSTGISYFQIDDSDLQLSGPRVGSGMTPFVRQMSWLP
jgi:hypothetical protein